MPKDAPSLKPVLSNKTANRESTPPARTGRSKWTILLLLLFIVSLLAAGAAGAIHYKFVDLAWLDEKLGLSNYPFIGRYIKPVSQEITGAVDEVAPKSPQAASPEQLAPKSSPILQQSLPRPPVTIDDSELKKQAALKQHDEQKRLITVSRLYDGMKPEAAAPILSELEDETVILIFSKMDQENVAKILTLFDPKRSARLSNLMLKGQINE